MKNNKLFLIALLFVGCVAWLQASEESGDDQLPQAKRPKTSLAQIYQDARKREIERKKAKKRERANEQLLSAAWGDDVSSAKEAIAYGANVNFQDQLGNTALYYATVFAPPDSEGEVVQYLLQVGANPMIPNNEQKIPIEQEPSSTIRKLLSDAMPNVMVYDLYELTQTEMPAYDAIKLDSDHWFLRNQLFEYIISKLGTSEGAKNPYTNVPIDPLLVTDLVVDTNIPPSEVRLGGLLYDLSELEHTLSGAIQMEIDPELIATYNNDLMNLDLEPIPLGVSQDEAKKIAQERVNEIKKRIQDRIEEYKKTQEEQ